MSRPNQKLELARQIIERTGQSLFLTGKAGTGKTTFLRQLHTSSRKRMVITAPTGIAAINAGGMTLHSFFQLDFGPFVPGSKRKTTSGRRSLAFNKEKIRMIRGLDLLVIDEISMVRADMLDAVDDVLRRFRDRSLPFGGVQLLLIGDLQQLPPVVTEAEKEIMAANYDSPYFFDSNALKSLDYLTIELSEVYRQQDIHFIGLLNSVRDNKLSSSILESLNSRYRSNFNPSDQEGYIRLTTHNRTAARINQERLLALSSEEHTFIAEIEGNFPESSYPAESHLVLKEGAQVMFIKNDTGSAERRFFNGMLGTVTSIDENGVIVTPTDSDRPVRVEPVEWENIKFTINDETKEIIEKREGVFRQIPLKLAWAITIHKSQGLTFDRAIIDTSMSFTHGQTYVALSRCRTLEGMVLDRPLSRSSVITDPTVSLFLKTHPSLEETDEATVSTLTHAYFIHLIGELFNFRPVFNIIEGLIRILKENFMRLYPSLIVSFSEEVEKMKNSVLNVAARFGRQVEEIDRSGGDGENNSMLIQRIKDAAVYFQKQLEEIRKLADTLPAEHDNKSVNQKLDDRREMLDEALFLRGHLLSVFAVEDFDVEKYLDVKAYGIFKKRHSLKSGKKAKPAFKSEFTEDNLHPDLFDVLCDWRRSECEKNRMPAYTVARTRTLLSVSNYLPRTYEDLSYLPGIGASMIKKYGDDLLALVDAFVSNASDGELKPMPIPRKKKRH